MSGIACFLIEPTDRERRWLRRYRFQSVCRVCLHGYHQISVPVGDGDVAWTDPDPQTGLRFHQAPPASAYADDPRWPTAYPCGEPVRESDERQVFTSTIYRRHDTGEEYPLLQVPVGAMWDATWLPWKGPDGRCWVVQTPAGEWCIDGPSQDGGRWTRTGTAPRLTVTPSIGIGHGPGFEYHGWLRDGVLVAA